MSKDLPVVHAIPRDTKLIYGLVDPRTLEVRYVGRSSSGLQRPALHGAASVLAKDKSHKARWIRELLSEGITYEIRILEFCHSLEALIEAEERWIWAGFRLGWPLTNGTFDGGKPIEVSPETRALISAAKRGRPRPDLIGKPRPDVAQRNRVSQSKETIAKRVSGNRAGISNAKLKGIPRSEEVRAKMRAGWARRKAMLAAAAGQAVLLPNDESPHGGGSDSDGSE